MKTLLTLAIVLASTSAFATRARVTALGSAAHLKDAATVYINPADIFVVSDSVTIESGATNLVPGTDAINAGTEALLIKSSGDAKWALSLGHDDVRSYAQRTDGDVAGTAIIAQQNPIELSYGMKAGDLAWAGTLVYSNFNNKVADVKESTTSLKFGVNASAWAASVDVGLVDKWEDGTNSDEFKGKSNVALRGGYWVSSDLYTHGRLAMTGYEVTDAAAVVSDVKGTEIELGAINTMKNDGNEFFWGASLLSVNDKDDTADVKSSSLHLPLVIGLEANAASWLTLRGSVTQSVLIHDDKVEDATSTVSETAPGLNSTAFAAGAGLKLGKLAVDGSILAGAANQNIDADNLLGTVGLTYSF